MLGLLPVQDQTEIFRPERQMQITHMAGADMACQLTGFNLPHSHPSWKVNFDLLICNIVMNTS